MELGTVLIFKRYCLTFSSSFWPSLILALSVLIQGSVTVLVPIHGSQVCLRWSPISILDRRATGFPIVLQSHARSSNLLKQCARAQRKTSFRYFVTTTWTQKAKLIVNFLAFRSVKFRKISQTGNKYLNFVGARYSGKSIRPAFPQRLKTEICKNLKNCLYKPYFYRV